MPMMIRAPIPRFAYGSALGGSSGARYATPEEERYGGGAQRSSSGAPGFGNIGTTGQRGSYYDFVPPPAPQPPMPQAPPPPMMPQGRGPGPMMNSMAGPGAGFGFNGAPDPTEMMAQKLDLPPRGPGEGFGPPPMQPPTTEYAGPTAQPGPTPATMPGSAPQPQIPPWHLAILQAMGWTPEDIARPGAYGADPAGQIGGFLGGGHVETNPFGEQSWVPDAYSGSDAPRPTGGLGAPMPGGGVPPAPMPPGGGQPGIGVPPPGGAPAPGGVGQLPGGGGGVGAPVPGGGPGILSYGPEAWQNMPSLRYLMGGMNRGQYLAGNANPTRSPTLGINLPSQNSLNFGSLLDIYDAGGFEPLSSAFRSGNRDLATEMALSRMRAPIGSGVNTGLISTGL